MRMILLRAVCLGSKYNLEEGNNLWYNIRLKLYRWLVFNKWKAALGGNIKLIVSGGSALQPRLSRIFWAAGIPILEGYGLTETSPVISVNHYTRPNNKIGTVGPVIDDVQVKIAEDGEILSKGPNLMLGYYKDKKMTDEVIDKEGWFHTGDIGVLYEGKFLKITDRKKSIFKTSAGKYVAPQVIENKLRASLFIQQAMVVGESEKFVSAILSPNFQYLHDWCIRSKIKFRDNKELLQMPEIINLYQKVVEKTNRKLSQIEQVKRFRLVCEQWSPVNGELSPTLKLRRNVLYKKYDHIFKEIYNYEEGEINRALKENK